MKRSTIIIVPMKNKLNTFKFFKDYSIIKQYFLKTATEYGMDIRIVQQWEK